MAPKSAGAIPGALDLLIRKAVSQERWRAILTPYERPDNRRSLLQLAVTLVLYGAAWAVLLRSVEVGYWATAIVALPAAGLMVRLIIIQHDCSHGSYFTSQRACNAVGTVVAMLSLTPYDYLKRVHVAHHAHSGNLDRRAGGDIPTLTVAEYAALGWWRRLGYRLIRNPFVLMGVLTPLQFVVVHRFPWSMPRSWTREWRSVWGTNAALAAVLVGIWLVVGVERLEQIVIIQGMIMLYGGAFAGWLTHTQHQFENAYWHRFGAWDYFDAGLQGASWLALPKPLQWLTASIGLHHVHHLSTPHSELPPAALSRRESGTVVRPPHHVAGRVQGAESGALGRTGRQADLVRRIPPVGPIDLSTGEPASLAVGANTADFSTAWWNDAWAEPPGGQQIPFVWREIPSWMIP